LINSILINYGGKEVKKDVGKNSSEAAASVASAYSYGTENITKIQFMKENLFFQKKMISVTFSSNGKILLQEQLSAESKISYHIGLLYWKLLSYWTKTGFLKCYIFGPKFTKNDM
jgi:hypothetical protein